jgi:hypothetical protein
MKKVIYIAVAIATLAACCKDDDSQQGATPVKITAGLNDAGTRCLDTNWNNDVIGVSVVSDTRGNMTNATNTNVQYATSENGTTATFTPVVDDILFNPNYDGVATFAAYGPYSSAVKSNLIEINTEDNNDSAEHQEKNLDFIFATGAKATFNNPNVAFTSDNAFKHKMVMLNITLKTVKTSDLKLDIEDVTSIILGGLKHKGTFNIATGAVTPTGEVVDNWEIKDLNKTTSGNACTYSLILMPQTLDIALPLSITVGGKTYVNRSGIKPDMTEGGKSLNYSISVQGNEGIVIEGCTINSWSQSETVSGDAFQEI